MTEFHRVSFTTFSLIILSIFPSYPLPSSPLLSSPLLSSPTSAHSSPTLFTKNSNSGPSQKAMWMFNSLTSFLAKSPHCIMKHIHQREENQIAVNQSLPCLSSIKDVYRGRSNTLWGLTRVRSLIK